jgi:eukaryotic-like serine/threonine-protein kinase
MGFVYAAHHQMLGHAVALKILRPDAVFNANAVARFLTEARAAACIENEHVARVTDVGTYERLGTPYMVMELLEGADLERVLTERGRLPIAETIDHVLAAIEGLSEAHALGLVHRDLKPANLFLAQRGDGTSIVKVLDFGVSKASEALGVLAQEATTGTHQILGTPLYMSPEQLKSSKSVDARADIWALGVVIFELLTGEPPFPGPTVGEVFSAVFEHDPPLLRSRLPEAPEALERAVTRCLRRNPNERFANVGDLASAIAPFGTTTAAASLERIRRSLGRMPAQAPTDRSSTKMPLQSALASTTPVHGTPVTTRTAPLEGAPKRAADGRPSEPDACLSTARSVSAEFRAPSSTREPAVESLQTQRGRTAVIVTAVGGVLFVATALVAGQRLLTNRSSSATATVVAASSVAEPAPQPPLPAEPLPTTAPVGSAAASAPTAAPARKTMSGAKSPPRGDSSAASGKAAPSATATGPSLFQHRRE